MTFRLSMNSYRRGLRNGVLVNPKLFLLKKVNFGQHTKCWSNLVKSSQTWSNVLQTCIIWYGSLHTTPLLHGQARIVLQYSLISATELFVNVSALLLCATAPQYCTVPSGTYCVVSYSFCFTGVGSQTVI